MLTILNKRLNDGRIRETTVPDPPLLIIVPEQYSHEAERELAESLGDSAALYAEVLTFTRLASRVFVECGGLNLPAPDKPAKILLMRLAYGKVSERLKVYGGRNARIEFLTKLLELREEFMTCKITPDMIWEHSVLYPGTLSDKLRDLSIICTAYDVELASRYEDSRDKLTRLAAHIGNSSIGDRGVIRFDGFSDFTKQQLDVIIELLRKNTELEFVLTTLPCYTPTAFDDEILAIPLQTARTLTELAGTYGIDVRSVVPDEVSSQPPESQVYVADDISCECENAADLIIKWLSEDNTLGLSDIAVVSPGFTGEYEAVCRSVFGRRGIPFYLSHKDDILQKAVMTLVTEVFVILAGGWRYEQMFRYLKTNLTGLKSEETDELENYILTWNIRGVKKWSEPFTMNPRGYVPEEETTESDISQLERVETARQSVVKPLLQLRERGKSAKNAAEHSLALYDFLEVIQLAEQLERKSEEFLTFGEEKLAAEYAQLWESVVSALESLHSILDGTPMEQEEFGKLFTLLLGQYDLSTIPPALNRVRLGAFEDIRETPVKRLIVMGASDTSMPRSEPISGLLSADERRVLSSAGLEIQGDFETNLKREYFLIGRVLSKASERVAISYISSERLSWLAKAFVNSEEPVSVEEKLASASARNHELARISPESAAALYGEKLSMSASRVEGFQRCKFKYFMEYGMKAKARKTAGFDAPEFGTLVHYVLQNVTKKVQEFGGFTKVDEATIKKLAIDFVDRYAEERIRKSVRSGRFEYLFSRLRDEVVKMTVYIASELASSNFTPSGFERELKSTELGGVSIHGIIDRVDALELGDTLYVRVADYKTGLKKFSLSDVYYGLGMQMLIYLFALQGTDAEFIPAGVYYTPAREVLQSLPRRSSDEEIAKEKRKTLKGSGIILDELSAESEVKVASLEKMGRLAKLVEARLREVSIEIQSGTVNPDAAVLSGTDPCDYCVYNSVCALVRQPDYKRKLKTIKDSEFWDLCPR